MGKIFTGEGEGGGRQAEIYFDFKLEISFHEFLICFPRIICKPVIEHVLVIT